MVNWHRRFFRNLAESQNVKRDRYGVNDEKFIIYNQSVSSDIDIGSTLFGAGVGATDSDFGQRSNSCASVP